MKRAYKWTFELRKTIANKTTYKTNSTNSKSQEKKGMNMIQETPRASICYTTLNNKVTDTTLTTEQQGFRSIKSYFDGIDWKILEYKTCIPKFHSSEEIFKRVKLTDNKRKYASSQCINQNRRTNQFHRNEHRHKATLKGQLHHRLNHHTEKISYYHHHHISY